MTEIGAFEAKNTLGTLLDRVEHGEEIVITRHGKPVARLVPNSGRIDQRQAQSAFQRIRERAQRLQPPKLDPKKSGRNLPGRKAFDWQEIKVLRDEGRR
jgi:prevent-host-death family protein